MTAEATLAYARRCDAADPLREFRDQFALPRDEHGQLLIYLCGQSLGLQPLAAREAVNQELDDWARLGVRGHEHARRPWIHYHEALAPGLERLTGARPGEVVAMSSLTIDLHLMLASFFQPQGERVKILIEAGAFPSDRHAVVSHLEWHGLDPRRDLIELAPAPGEDLLSHEAIEECLEKQGAQIALVLWPGVQFRTGQSFDGARVAAAGHRAGCAVGLDLAHSIGNTPLDLHASDADFAVWCSYKYLNAGPGAIGGCFVHERHSGPSPRGRLAGWWGHELATRFEMKPGFRAAAGAAGWQVSNPPVMAAAPLISSLATFEAAGLARLREKSVALTGFLETLVDGLGPDVRIITPRAPAERGCQLSLRIAGGGERGRRVFEWLARNGAVCDWRGPDIIRVAPVPLYNSFGDVHAFGAKLTQALRGKLMAEKPVNIIGAGLAGALLAVLLARRGFTVNLFEKRPDPRTALAEHGRSINLALAARGIRALERAGVMARMLPLLIPMRGRMVHEHSGATTLLPYGQREHEVIHSVGRAPLNRLLIEEAARYPQVTLRFGQSCIGVDVADDALRFRDAASGKEYQMPLEPTIAADGGGSAIRRGLADAGLIEDSEEMLDHDYKELTLPPVGARHALDPHALHLWPRGGFMLIALPNPDLSFTATLFLSRHGSHSFDTLDSPRAVEEFFRREFPDAVPLIPQLLEEFAGHPQSRLGTVRAAPWHLGGKVLLLGDAAHAMVPFHGQGMNAAFEDCAEVNKLVGRHKDWTSLFAAFEEQRRPHAAAIAQMALENYVEMRDTVRDARFARHKALSLELEKRFPDRFIPRYSMVMFHPEIPYGEALRRGAVQAEILDALDSGRDAAGNVDAQLAGQLVRERLSALQR